MKRILTLSVLAAVGAAASAQTYNGGGGTILDNQDNTSTITVGGNGMVVGTFVNVVINNLTHSWVGDMTATLSKTGGPTVNLFVRCGVEGAGGFGQSDDVSGNYSFADGNSQTMWEASFIAAGSMTGGNFKPAGGWVSGTGQTATLAAANLSDFVGTAIDGDWVLNVADGAGGDTGAWTDWSFTVQGVPEPGTLLAVGAGLALLAARRRK